MALFSKNFLFGYFIMGICILIIVSIWVDTPSTTIQNTNIEVTERSYYEPLLAWTNVNNQTLFVSVADTDEERQLGLSDTTNLPTDVVKLFIFETENTWSFWMKDMSYAIDIVWLNAAGEVVYVIESVSPDTYPSSFSPSVPAKYVIETNAGQSAQIGLKVGEKINIESIASLSN